MAISLIKKKSAKLAKCRKTFSSDKFQQSLWLGDKANPVGLSLNGRGEITHAFRHVPRHTFNTCSPFEIDLCKITISQNFAWFLIWIFPNSTRKKFLKGCFFLLLTTLFYAKNPIMHVTKSQNARVRVPDSFISRNGYFLMDPGQGCNKIGATYYLLSLLQVLNLF